MISAALALALVLVVPGSGQSGNEGSIEGTVSDGTGAVVRDAAVTARNVGTAVSLRAVTDDRGRFRFLIVPVGRYEITAEHAGFVKVVHRDVEVTVGARVNIPVTLRVGNHEEAMTVVGDTPLVETSRTSFGSTVHQRSVASLPLNGRNFLNFILLTPAITPSSNGGGFSGGFYSVGGQISMNSLLIDGADHNGFASAPAGSTMGNRYLFSQEAIQEFQVNTASYSAEFGRAGTAVINVITKSGTNEYHGAAFWYYRDQALNAKGYMEQVKGEPKAPSRSNQFGGALGGPVVKDRLFFYASYDGQRRSEQNLTWLNLPSTFALSSNPTIAHYQQLALDYLEPRADSYARTFEQNVILGKVDWHLAGRHTLSAQWNRHRLQAPNIASQGAQQSWEHNGTDGQVGDTLIGSFTSQLTPDAVNVARASYVSYQTPQTGNSANPEAVVWEGGLQVLQIGRLPRLAENGVRRAELADTVSLALGRHAIRAGGNLLVERARLFSAVNFYGSYLFNSLESFGRSLSGTQAGERYIQAFSGQGTPPIDVRPNSVQLAALAQDTWRIRRDLTFDLGLRYDVQIMEQSAVFNSTPALVAAGVDTTFIPTDGNNFAPRLGLAWTPGGSQRLVVRAGYGVFFPRLLAGTAARPFFYNGITAQTRTFTGAAMPTYPNTKCGPPDPSGAPPTCAAPVTGRDIIMAIPRDYRQPSVEQGTLGLEYALGKDLAVSVTYLRVKGDHLTHWQDINLPDPVMQTIGVAKTTESLAYRYYPVPPRPIAGFDRVFLLETNGYSSYHGLSFQANKRWSRGFQFTASYTFAKVIDDNPTDGALNPGPGDSELLSDSRDPGLDRGPGDFGVRHRFVLGGIWALNYASHLPQPARAILSDWQLSAIVTASSGAPYSALLGSLDLNNDGNTSTDRTPGVGRNTFVLPSFVSVDPRLTRNVKISHRAALQLSVDAFNVFNRVNISGVRATQFSRSPSPATCGIARTPCLVPQLTGATAFGTPTAASDPRMLQLSVRLVF